jgi:hypothetical protein
LIGGDVLEGLNVIVDGDGNGAGGPGEIAAHHEDDAKFAEGVGEGEDDSSDYAWQRKRKNDAAESAPLICAENAGGGEKLWIKSLERGDEWLDAKWKTVEDACNDEACEGESERVTEEGEPEFAERAARAHGYEEIETEHGGRENEWESDNGFDEEFSAPF